MRNLKAILEDAKKIGVSLSGRGWDRYAIESSDKDEDEDNYWDGWNEPLAEFEVGQSTYSCGVPEFGQFSGNAAEDKHLELLLEYFIQTAKLPFYRCYTLNNGEYRRWNRALKKLGFECIARCKSKHGRYKINVMELWPTGNPRKGKASENSING